MDFKMREYQFEKEKKDLSISFEQEKGDIKDEALKLYHELE